MKKHFVTGFLAAALGAGSVIAGPEAIIQQRARDVANQNNVRQGIGAPVAPAQPTPTKPAATAAQGGITGLQRDLAALKAGTPATPAQIQALNRDLNACAVGAARPSAANVSKLASDLAAAYTDKAMSAGERARLVQDLNALMNAANYKMPQIDTISSDVLAVFQANGVSRKTAAAVSDDARTIALEIAKGSAH